MKKFCFLFLVTCFSFFQASAQDQTTTSYKRPPAIGISFLFNDFLTAQRIRSTSLSSVRAKKQGAKLGDMNGGIGISYFKGVTDKIDFAATLTASSAQTTVNGGQYATERSLIEADASLNLKLLSDRYWVSPYAIVGAGLSKYGVYYGAFIPVGAGLKVNLSDEAAFFINSQYRIPVTSATTSYHFMHSIGIAGNIGK